MTDTEYKNTNKNVWICSFCCRKRYNRGHTGIKIIQEVCGLHSVQCQGEPPDYLDSAKSRRKNLQFLLETPKGIGDMAFLDLNIKLKDERKIRCQWYQKLTDTSLILNFPSCAPL